MQHVHLYCIFITYIWKKKRKQWKIYFILNIFYTRSLKSWTYIITRHVGLKKWAIRLAISQECAILVACCTRTKWCRPDLQVCATSRPGEGVEKFNFRIYGLTRGKKFRHTSGCGRPIIDICGHFCHVARTLENLNFSTNLPPDAFPTHLRMLRK